MARSHPYIRPWGESCGSADYYITDREARARECDAPTDALFEVHDASGPTGEWACFSDLPENNPFRKRMEKEGLPT